MRRATGLPLQRHQILDLPRKMTLMSDVRRIWNVIYNARSNRTPPATSPNTGPATQNDSHEWCPSHLKRHLQCAEQQDSPSNVTKYWTCHAKWLSWVMSVAFETSFTMRGATATQNDIPKSKRNSLTKSDTPRSPNAAPATKSDTPTSPNTAPATKSDTPRSPNAAPATKSDTPTSPNTAPATWMHCYFTVTMHCYFTVTFTALLLYCYFHRAVTLLLLLLHCYFIPLWIRQWRWAEHFVDTIRRVPRSGHTKWNLDQKSLQNEKIVSNKMACPTLQKYNLVAKFPDRNKSGISDHNPDPYNLVRLHFFDPWQFESRHWEWREWFFLCKNHGGKTQWIRIKFPIFFYTI